MTRMDPRQLGLSDEDLAALGYTLRGAREVSADTSMNDDPPDVGAPPPSRVRLPAASSGEGRRWIWTVVLLVACLWGAGTGRHAPPTAAANQPDSVFSSARAMAQLVDIARGPRPPGSPEHARVAGLLRQRLAGLGLDVDTVAASSPFWTVTDSIGATVEAMTPDNVVARLRGDGAGEAVLLIAHYDTRPSSPGAGDGALGIAAVLEALRAVVAGPPLHNDVIVLFADGEQLGGLGVRSFVETHPWMEDVRFAVSLEHGGAAGTAWVRGLEGTGADGIRSAVVTSLAVELPGVFGEGSAPAMLTAGGVSGVVLGTTGGRGWHGTALDAPIRVEERTLSHHGVQLLSILRGRGGERLEPMAATGGDAMLRTTVTGLGIVSYPSSWSPGLTLGVVLGWLALILLLYRSGARPVHLGTGVALGLLGVVAGGALSRVLTVVVASGHPEFGQVPGGVFSSESHLVVLGAAVTAAMSLLYAVARLRVARAELVVGALLAPVGMLAWMTLAAPSAVVALQIPLMVALVQAGALWLLASTRLGGRSEWLVVLVASATVFGIVVPSAEWAGPVLWPERDLFWGACVAVVVLLVLPALDVLTRPRPWLTPAMSGLVAIVVLAIGFPELRGMERHPMLTSLTLVFDDEGVATSGGGPGAMGFEVLVDADQPSTVDDGAPAGGPDSVAPSPNHPSDRVAPRSGAPVRHIAGTWLTVPGAGAAWSRSWAVVGGTTDRTITGLLLPAEDEWVVAGAGPGAEVAPPTMEIVQVETRGVVHTVVVDVHSGLQGLMTGLRIPDDVRGAFVSIAGAPLPPTVRPTSLSWWGPTPVRVALEISAATPTVAIDVVEHHMDPRAILGPDFFTRNETVVPDARTGSDRIVQRTRMEIGVPTS